ncbi:hypothetical protein U9M48_025737 [Paspalum notatum var. saurae]|uniref:F-box domain-containing protein n=1 Tax=Paspalum notatum var. saurae TaxID=547442 RepID=A0AAQ3WY11_PASNO
MLPHPAIQTPQADDDTHGEASSFGQWRRDLITTVEANRRKKMPDDDAPAHAPCASQAAQISHFPRLKRRPRERKTTTDDDDTAHASVSTRRSSYFAVRWGAKRLRTGTAVGGRRDWSDLDEGPVGLIAERVLAADVADYIRFRAVCHLWRRCCDDPRAHAVLGDRRLHPRRWIMLHGERERERLDTADAPHRVRRRFLNVSSRQCIQVDVSELRDHGVLRSTTDGLLLLVGTTTTQALRLLNPLTRQVAELPHFPAGMRNPRCFIGEYSADSAGLVDKDGHHTVFLYISGNPRTLAFVKPGDERCQDY